MLKYGYSESLSNTLYVKIKHKCSFEENEWYKRCTLFLSWAPLHKSFNFDPPFLHELKRKVRLSKSVYRIFDPVSLMLMFILLFDKKHGPLDFKNSYNFLQNQNNGKLTHTFAPRPLTFRLKQEVLSSVISEEGELFASH